MSFGNDDRVVVFRWWFSEARQMRSGDGGHCSSYYREEKVTER